MSDIEAIRRGLRARAAEAAAALLGVPSSRSGSEWRWGRKGSLAVAVRGEKAGLWHDHEVDAGGDLLALCQREHRCDFLAALEWARSFLGLPQPEPRKRKLAPAKASATGAPAHAAAVLPAPTQAPAALVLVSGGDDAGKRDNSAAAGRVWDAAQPIEDTHAADYLAARGLALPDGHALRFAPDLVDGGTGKKFPAMVARVQEHDGTFRAVHRTYLDRVQPVKAPMGNAKKGLGSPGTGGVWLTTQRGPHMLVGEGIETTLAGLAGNPDAAAVSAISASGLAKLNLPPRPDASLVTILVDDDNGGAGLKHARAAAERWSGEGRTVRLAWADKGRGGGFDFADLLRERGPDAVRDALAAAEPFVSDAEGDAREFLVRKTVEAIQRGPHAVTGTHGPIAPRYPDEADAEAADVAAGMASTIDDTVKVGVRYVVAHDLRHGIKREALRQVRQERPDLAAAAIYMPKGSQQATEWRDLLAKRTRKLRAHSQKALEQAGWPLHPSRPAPLVIRASAGLGKSHATLHATKAAIDGVPAGMPALGTILVPNHKLAEEMRANAVAIGLPAVVLAGRGPGKDRPALCQRHEAAAAVSRAGLSVRRALCGKPGGEMCPFRTTCGYYGQVDALPHRGLVIATHDALARGELPGDVPMPSFVIVDEDPAGVAVPTPEPLTVEWLRNPAVWAGVFIADTTEERAAMEDAASRMLMALADLLQGQVYGTISPDGWRDYLSDRGITLTGIADLRDVARKQAQQAAAIHAREIRPSMADGDIVQAASDMGAARSWRERAALLEAVHEDWTAGHPRLQSVGAYRKDAEDGPRTMFHVLTKRPFKVTRNSERGGRDRAVLVLDASADKRLVPLLWGDDARIEQFDAKRHAQMIQVVSPSFSMKAVGARPGSATQQTEHRLEHIRAGLRALVVLHGPDKVGLLTYKKLFEREGGSLFADIEGLVVGHIGGVRGSNKFKNVEVLVIIGRLEPPAWVMENQARALVRGSGIALDCPGKYDPRPQGIRMRDGTGVTVNIWMHRDPTVQACLERSREREQEQVVDRVRAVRRQGNPPTIYLMTDVPLDLTVDRVVGLHEWAIGVAVASAVAKDGAFAATLAALRAVAPEVFSNPDGSPVSDDTARRRWDGFLSGFIANLDGIRKAGGPPAKALEDNIMGLRVGSALCGFKSQSNSSVELAIVGANRGRVETQVRDMLVSVVPGLMNGPSMLTNEVLDQAKGRIMSDMNMVAAPETECAAIARFHAVAGRGVGGDAAAWLGEFLVAWDALPLWARDQLTAVARTMEDVLAPQLLAVWESIALEAISALDPIADRCSRREASIPVMDANEQQSLIVLGECLGLLEGCAASLGLRHGAQAKFVSVWSALRDSRFGQLVAAQQQVAAHAA
jgi:hypothetical protein